MMLISGLSSLNTRCQVGELLLNQGKQDLGVDQQPSKLKVAGSNPAGVATPLHHQTLRSGSPKVSQTGWKPFTRQRWKRIPEHRLSAVRGKVDFGLRIDQHARIK